MKITERDKKLLGYLFHNNRDSLTEIAKECNIPRQLVDYHIKKYKSEGIIKKFFTVYNYNKLGYNSPSLLLVKLKNNSQKEVFLKSLPNNIIISQGNVLSKYSLFFNLIFKDKTSSNLLLSKILSQDIVEKYLIIDPYIIELYSLKFLEKNIKDNIYDLKSENTNIIPLDLIDKGILKCLNMDGRIKIIDIAKSLNSKPEIILYKLKKLQKEKIIIGNRIHFNMKKMGYYYTLVLVNLKNLDDEKEKKILKFFRTNKYINSCGLFVNNPNCFFQIFHKSENELRETIKSFEEEIDFNDFELEIIPIEENEDDKINTLPFY